MDMLLRPGLLSGSVTPPPSKSQSHRLLMAAWLAGEPDCVRGLARSQDLDATRRCMEALCSPEPLPLLDCGESGSTLRFLIPLVLVLRGGGSLTGHGRLMERPQGPYEQICRSQGVRWTARPDRLTLRGKLTPGDFSLPGDVSSQFITGLLFALPLLPGDSTIRLTSPLESRDYVDLTLEVLRAFSVRAEWMDQRTLSVPGGQAYQPAPLAPEADWSQAAFWCVAGALGSALVVSGLNRSSTQGDRAAEALIRQLVRPGDLTLDLRDYPDLVPPLAVLAAARTGTAVFAHIARLRLKESDRIASTAALVRSLGGQAEEQADALVIRGVPRLSGGTVDGANDHRIVMAAAVAATACTGPVTIRGAQAVRKSYPTFWDEFTRLGGICHVI